MNELRYQQWFLVHSLAFRHREKEHKEKAKEENQRRSQRPRHWVVQVQPTGVWRHHMTFLKLQMVAKVPSGSNRRQRTTTMGSGWSVLWKWRNGPAGQSGLGQSGLGQSGSGQVHQEGVDNAPSRSGSGPISEVTPWSWLWVTLTWTWGSSSSDCEMP